MTHLKSSNNLIKAFVREYVDRRGVYDDFAASVRRLLVLFCRSAGVTVYSITYRTKEVYNLKQKIKRKMLNGRTYEKLDDIVDLAGVRVILYFKDDIEKVEKIISEEFQLHKKHNVDQLNVSKDSKYESGYTSIHRVVSLSKNRLKLKEYRTFSELKCEIQVRTLLQHTWAQIEHGIGYKPEIIENGESRVKIKKLFHEAATLLEKADRKFMDIHNSHLEALRTYSNKIKRRRLNIPVNYESVQSYVLKSPDEMTLSKGDIDLTIEMYLKLAEDNRLRSIKELDTYLAKQSDTMGRE